MEIYVQSRGFSEEHDYFWLDKNQKLVDEHKLVKQFKDLIQSEKQSVLLVRDTGELLLLVTGIRTSDRRDYRGRTILNSVAWVGEDTDEFILRTLAVRALKSFLGEDTLTSEIDDVVKPDKEEGFQVVDFEAIEADKLAEPVKNQIGNNQPDTRIKIGKSDKRAVELASELEKCCLPKQKDQEPLIVVFTAIKAQSALEKAGVWRGLSSIVEQERWEVPYKQSPSFSSGAKSSQTAQNTKIWIYLFAAISLIAIFIILYLLLSQPQPKLNQETQLLPQPVSPSTQPVQSPSPSNQVLENKLNAAPGISEIQTPSIGLVKQIKTPTSLDKETVNTDNSVPPEATSIVNLNDKWREFKPNEDHDK